MEFKFVISDPKTKKSYQIKKGADMLIGMKIGQTFDGHMIELKDYELKITGGSDTDGFPMRKDVHGHMRKKILLSNGLGFKSKIKGQRKRKNVRGNEISKEISQINCVITKYGSKKIEELVPKKEEK